jgi:methionyl aminopeptidase
MVFAIEPMINAGVSDIMIMDDSWTAVTKDGKLSAHFEHMVYITEDVPKILTEWEG